MKKCKFAKSKIKLLGYQISAKETIPDLDKIIVIETLERLIIVFKLREFLGVVSFFRKYIQGFEQIAKPLNDMISVKFKNCWISEMDEAWKELKKQLTEAPIFKHLDFTKLFILYTDISKKKIGIILV